MHKLPRVINMISTDAYADWLDQFAVHQRMPRALVVERAIEQLADRQGFKPPPMRVPRNQGRPRKNRTTQGETK